MSDVLERICAEKRAYVARLKAEYPEARLVDALAEVLAADALSKIANNDRKVADSEAIAKRFKDDNAALLKQLDETNAGLETLA